MPLRVTSRRITINSQKTYALDLFRRAAEFLLRNVERYVVIHQKGTPLPHVPIISCNTTTPGFEHGPNNQKFHCHANIDVVFDSPGPFGSVWINKPLLQNDFRRMLNYNVYIHVSKLRPNYELLYLYKNST